MKKILFLALSILISSTLLSTNFAYSETEGVHIDDFMVKSFLETTNCLEDLSQK